MRPIRIVLWFLLALVPFVRITAQQTAAPQTTPADCWFTPPAGYTPECSLMTVPENRADPNSAPIQIAAAVFRGQNPAPDPLIYLQSRAGGRTLDDLPPILDTFTAQRDVILYDYRGTGYSVPPLACPGYFDALAISLQQLLTRQQQRARLDAQLTACRAALGDRDLSGYTTEQHAADVDDLRRALGYDTVNLLGVGYGARVAAHVAAHYPVRSLILVSPQSAFNTDDGAFTRALDQLNADCSTDPACRDAYGDLTGQFTASVAQLSAFPGVIYLADPLSPGPQYPVLSIYVNGDRYAETLRRALVDGRYVPLLPAVISSVSDLNFDSYGYLQALVIEDENTLERGAYHAALCSEVGAEAVPTCAGWGSAAQPTPTPSYAVPDLVISGIYDPEAFPRGHIVSGGQFAPLLDDCTLRAMVDFLAQPAASFPLACAAGLDPILPGELALIPFHLDRFASVFPYGWVEQQIGVFVSPDGVYNLMFARVPYITPEEFLQAVVINPLTGYVPPETLATLGQPQETLTANGLTWTLYSVQVMERAYVDFALTRYDGTQFVVQLSSATSDVQAHEAQVTDVFRPVVLQTRLR